MDEPKKKQKKHNSNAEKHEIEEKTDDMTLGDELLIEEYNRHIRAKNLLEKHKLDKEKSNP